MRKQKKTHKSIAMYFKIKTKDDIEFDLRQFEIVDENSNVYDV